MTYAELLHGMQMSIKGEMNDYEYYVRLAQMAPNNEAAEMILDFAKDEKDHAAALKDAYYRLTGRMAPEVMPDVPNIPSYGSALRERVLAETKDGEKYRDYYLSTKLDWLRDVFYKTSNDEAEHATRLLLLITDEHARHMMDQPHRMPMHMMEGIPEHML